MSDIIVDLQCDIEDSDNPALEQISHWVDIALQNKFACAEITIRIVDITESAFLNSTYRHKTGPTNVLSFPADLPEDIALDIPLLGDLIICAPLVKQEALEQNKPVLAHWAHLVIHGTLHLLGYDHIIEEEADIMEALEINYLATLGFNNPYEDDRVNEK